MVVRRVTRYPPEQVRPREEVHTVLPRPSRTVVIGVAISGDQWSSVVISGHQWSSVVISGYQKSSRTCFEVIVPFTTSALM